MRAFVAESFALRNIFMDNALRKTTNQIWIILRRSNMWHMQKRREREREREKEGLIKIITIA